MLLELHAAFEAVDLDADWNRFKVAVLPDLFTLNFSFARKVEEFLASDGKLLLFGQSGLEIARVYLNEQREHNRAVLHLLYVTPQKRGADTSQRAGNG